jgi:hypothetical protein
MTYAVEPAPFNNLRINMINVSESVNNFLPIANNLPLVAPISVTSSAKKSVQHWR